LLSFGCVYASRRNDAYNVIGLTIAVTHDQDAQRDTQAEKHEAFFGFGVLGIGNYSGVLVQKRCSRLVEGHPVLRPVSSALTRGPLEANIGHADIVTTT
jgi:hypothetical protein